MILEEIAMTRDDPTDVAFENFVGAAMGQNPLGRPIGGTPQGDYAGPAGCCVGALQKVLRRIASSHLGGWSLEHSAHRKPCAGCAHPLRLNLPEGVAPVPPVLRTESWYCPVFSELHESARRALNR